MATYKFVDPAGNDADGDSWATAWQTIIQANGVAADTIVLVKGGSTFTAQDGATGACLNSSANGTISQPVTYQGDDASGGAGEGAAAMFTLDAGDSLNSAAYAAAWTVWKYCVFTGGTNRGLYCTSGTADNVLCYQCEFHTNGTTGAVGDNYFTFINCKFYNNIYGLDADTNTIVVGCEFYNNSGNDIQNVEANSVIVFNLFHEDNNVTCIVSNGSIPPVLIGNTFDGMTDGIAIDFTGASLSWPVVIGNCFYDLATGIQATNDIAGGFTAIRNNLFNSNTADVNANDNIRVGEDTQTAAPNFVNEDVDYHPDTGSPLIDNALDAGSIGV